MKYIKASHLAKQDGIFLYRRQTREHLQIWLLSIPGTKISGLDPSPYSSLGVVGPSLHNWGHASFMQQRCPRHFTYLNYNPTPLSERFKVAVLVQQCSSYHLSIPSNLPYPPNFGACNGGSSKIAFPLNCEGRYFTFLCKQDPRLTALKSLFALCLLPIATMRS